MNTEIKSAEEIMDNNKIYYSRESTKKAMHEFAHQESERRIDEFIEKVADGYENPDEEVALALLDAKTFKDWLKSLK